MPVSVFLHFCPYEDQMFSQWQQGSKKISKVRAGFDVYPGLCWEKGFRMRNQRLGRSYVWKLCPHAFMDPIHEHTKRETTERTAEHVGRTSVQSIQVFLLFVANKHEWHKCNQQAFTQTTGGENLLYFLSENTSTPLTQILGRFFFFISWHFPTETQILADFF